MSTVQRVDPVAALRSVRRYVAGRSAPVDGSGTAVKLSSNELAFGPLPSVERALTEAIGDINRYPLPRAEDLQAILASTLGVDVTEVAVGAGSSGLLWQLMAAFVAPGDRVVAHVPNFEAYPIAAGLASAPLVEVPLRDWRSDVDALIAAVDDRTKLVVVTNPHNPTGTMIDPASLGRLIDAVGDRALVLLDEAYIEFARPSEQRRWWRDHPNVVVLRTFSKAYGLAALRVGYALADPAVVAALGLTAPPFTVSGLSSAAAAASLAATSELDARVRTVCSERERVTARLRELGVAVPDSAANFVFLPGDDVPDTFVDELERAGVLVRPIERFGVRVTIGTPAENDRFLAECTGLLGGDVR
jgi:histidinol-phosphate aminotransferase